MVIRLSIGLAGCQTVALGSEKSCEGRDELDLDPLGQTLEQQVHFSKEAASGGLGSAGGGCGCN